jgi:hypothetical protein
MATFGDIYDLYNTEIGTWTGYNENETINDESYQPDTTANKGFFLECNTNAHHDPEEGGAMTGKTEVTVLGFALKVLYKHDQANTFAQNEKATWNLIDAAKKQLFDFSGGRGDIMFFGTIEKANFASDFKLVTFTFTVMFQWSMEIGG